VAGGAVDFRGYAPGCPSWTTLADVVREGMPHPEPHQYPQPPSPPAAECAPIVVAQDFDGPDVDAGPDGVWDGNGAGGHGIVAEEGGASYYRVSGRTSAGQGPRVVLARPECLTPGAPYLFSTRIRVSGPSPSVCSRIGAPHHDNSCPRLVLHATSSTGGQKLRRLGVFNGQHLPDGTWGTFQLQILFTAEEAGPSVTHEQTLALYLMGPAASADMAVDDFLLELAPPGTYPDPGRGVCAELLPNGDAEHGAGASIFPFTSVGGRAAVVVEDGNAFFRQSPAAHMRLQATLVTWTGCAVAGLVYRLSLNVQVHSAVPRQAEIVLVYGEPGVWVDYSTLLICPFSDDSSGFVACEKMVSFSPKQLAATSMTLFLRPRGDTTSTTDWDDLSLRFVEGPVKELLVDPALHACWRDQLSEGADILVTSHTLDFTDSQVVSAGGGMTAEGNIRVRGPLTNPMSGPDDFTVEIAPLSRRITLGASSADGGAVGGHFIVLHTPHVNQTLRGVEMRGFGQQGLLGRYPIHFHMCGNVHGSVVSKNVIRDSNQRCVVVHGTDALLVEDNVAYNTSGHCFTVEDGGEVDNVFRHNLGALTKKVHTLISKDETDDEPSTYWISNPQNSFENNVAAGSEGTGYWFELRTRVRGPSGPLHPGVNPSRLPLQRFVGNVAHSNRFSGLSTYPGA